MKITKEEKSLWNFLNIFKTIFSKTGNRTLVFGSGQSLYLHTIGYAGKFVSKKTYDKLLPDYDFSNKFYELKQLPNNHFVLDELQGDVISKPELVKIVSKINSTINEAGYRLEIFKHESYKLAKITESTGLWLADADVKYINAFPVVCIHQDYDSLIIQSPGIIEEEESTVTTYLLINQLDGKSPVQQKMDIRDEESSSEDEAEEEMDLLITETEDLVEEDEEYDPMSA